ncbi:putative colanic acid biosynthesis acetyltransferase [Bradyrhizobium sp. 151]|uniref:putative colanic acid biosynthesis acetyltransferase n=1 Tax=Bradyrhizobium sp. 151 TaxID=2782626 RepID=UPI001FFB2EF0|nr:putative colanic acid biosynthesis acetyltransferase [Bradyrhizobium sp. 151]
MGEHSVIGWDTLCYCQAPITLAEFAIVSQRVHLCAGTHDINDPNFQLVTQPIQIGRHAWVAADAFVGPGVTIGEGAVLGARAVTFKDLKPWSVYIGNPASQLKTRQRSVSIGADGGANNH